MRDSVRHVRCDFSNATMYISRTTSYGVTVDGCYVPPFRVVNYSILT
jgi:hypothetical protein